MIPKDPKDRPSCLVPQVPPHQALASQKLQGVRWQMEPTFSINRASGDCPAQADLLPDIGTEGHVGVELAVVEQVCLLQLSPQGTALDQVDVRDVGHIPDATKGERRRWRGPQAGHRLGVGAPGQEEVTGGESTTVLIWVP